MQSMGLVDLFSKPCLFVHTFLLFLLQLCQLHSVDSLLADAWRVVMEFVQVLCGSGLGGRRLRRALDAEDVLDHLLFVVKLKLFF